MMRYLILMLLFHLSGVPAAAQIPSRAVALTFDDLPFVYPSDEEVRSVRRRALLASKRIQRALAGNGAPATAFVTEEKLDALGDVGTRILHAWDRGPFELANHGFSHGDSNKMTLAEIEQEVLQGERISKPLARKAGRSLRFFRFPFNHVGDTQDRRIAVEQLLARHGYRLAASTIDTSDYLFGQAYERAISRSDGEMQGRIERAYLAYSRQQIQYYSDLNAKVLGYRPPEIIVLHLNSLNAAVADRLLKVFKELDYRFVSLAQAQSDRAYQQSPAHATRFGPMWGYRWARERGIKVDGSLEQEPPQWIATYAAGN
jgi:peptidoglycan/xylan/chitin deacetylase (PgdA/CDA1 family)